MIGQLMPHTVVSMTSRTSCCRLNFCMRWHCRLILTIETMTFIEMLQGAQTRNGSMLCVGLDPEPTRFPAGLKGDAGRIYDFCAAIVDATADLVIAFKP